MDEEQMQREVRRLTDMLAERDRENENLRIDLRVAQSTVKVQDAEIKLLSDVLARDRARVHAETAIAAHQIAMATLPQRRNQQDA